MKFPLPPCRFGQCLLSVLLSVLVLGGAALAVSPVAQPLLDPTDTTNNYGNLSTTTGSAIAMGGHAYFFTGDSSGTTHNLKLWKTDGTQATTTLVKDLGISGSLSNLMTNGTSLYFTTTSSGVGALWQSNGTTGGTSQVSGVGGATGTAGGRPGSLVLVGSTLYFAADSDGTGNFQLFRYTGTGSATQFTTRNNFGDTGRQNLGSINGILFWGGLSATGIVDVFRYDPANPVVNGTKVTSFSSGANLSLFVPDANGTSLFFEAVPGTDGTNNHWFRIESDGTGLKDLTPNGTNVNGTPFVKVGAYYYMTLSDSTHGTQIWRSDGTTSQGATLFSDHGTRTATLTTNFVALGTKLIFSGAFAGTTGTEPGVIDTTDANGTSSVLSDLFPGTTNSFPGNFTVAGSNVYFTATIATSTIKVFQTDGTSANTVQVADTKPGGSDGPSSLAAVGSALYFKAQTNDNTTANQRLPFILTNGTASPPTVTSINPTSGTTAGGTPVTITGTNFTGATGVTIGGTAATSVNVSNATTITCTTPAGSAGTASVLVTTPDGTNAGNSLYTYVSPPDLTVTAAHSPSTFIAGQTGSLTFLVSNTGAGATSGTINFSCVLPSGLTIQSITTGGGWNFTSSTTTTATGTMSSALGAGATAQTITVNVNIAANALASLAISATVSGGGEANLANDTGSDTIPVIYPPTVTAITPTSGTTAGGTPVTITGTNFTGATSVTIGGTAATSVNVSNASIITCTTPAGSAGTASVLVTTPGGTNAANSLYTYVAPIVVPTVIAPNKSFITATTTTLAGNVSSNGGASLLERGIVYALTSANADPIIGGSGVTKVAGSGTSTGAFSVAVGSLVANSAYTYKAYATNSAGTGYTAVDTFSTIPAPGPAGPPTVAFADANNTIFTRPGGNSYTWTISVGSTGNPNIPGTFPVVDASYYNVPAFSWNLTRGIIEYAATTAGPWTNLGVNNNPNYVTVANRVFRFSDSLPADSTTSNNVGVGWHLTSPTGTVGGGTVVVPDAAPTDITTDRLIILDSAALGDLIAIATPADTGKTQGGRWTIDAQSVGNLFALQYDNTTGNTAMLKKGTGTVPAAGQTATVTLRYNDWFQLDANGNPAVGQGFSKTLTFTVVAGSTNSLSNFAGDTLVNTYTSSLQLYPAMATLSNGNYVVVWQSQGQGKTDSTKSGVYGQIFTNTGSKVGGEFVISNASGTSDEINPGVTALNAGRFAVTYSTKTGADYNVGVRLVEANGTVGSEIIGNTTTASDQTLPTIATLTDGSFVVAWVTYTTTEIRLQQFAAAAGAKVGSEVLLTNAAGGPPGIAALDNGSYATSFFGASNVMVKVGPSGSLVDTGIPDGSYSVPPRLATLAGGFVMVTDTYDTPAQAYVNIKAVRYNNAGTIQGSVFTVNSNTTGGRQAPSVATLSGGGFVVAWSSDTDEGYYDGIMGRRFSATGVAADAADFQVNQYRYLDQVYPVVTGLAGNLFASAWMELPDLNYTNSEVKTRVLLSGPASPAPTVTLSTVALPATATTVTIAGTNFDTTAANNTVVFNDGAVGTVTNASATSLTVTFSIKPVSAGSLTAVVTNVSGNSGAAVQVATVKPVVTSSSISITTIDTTLTINGFGFDPTPANNTVAFSPAGTGTVSASTATSLTVTGISGLTAGALNAVVTSNGQGSGAAVQVAAVQAATVNKIIKPAAVLAAPAAVASYLPARAIDQSGLSPSYTSGVTSFETYVAGGPTHVPNLAPANFYAANISGYPQNIDFDLGAIYSLNKLAFWNYPFSQNGPILGFQIYTAPDAAFTSPTLVGTFAPANNGSSSGTAAVNVQVFNLTNSTARYVRMSVTSSNGTALGMSEIAFGVAASPPAVTLSTAALNANATTLTLAGTGFDATTPGNNTVVFSPSGTGTVTASTATSLTITGITGLTIGALNAVVTTNGLSSGAPVQVATVVSPAPSPLFTAGVDAPPGAPGTSYSSIRSGAVIASSGALAFRGYLTIGGSVDANNYMGMWKSPDGTVPAVVLVTRSGNTAPDSGSALYDILPVNPVINNAAQTTFLGMLRVSTGTPLVSTSTDSGVWSELGGQGLHLILREGDAITGGTTGAIAPSTTVVTGDAHTAFSVKLAPTGSALVRAGVVGATVTVTTIAKEGDAAPAVGGGTSGTFASLGGNSSDPRMDAAGDIAFLSNLQGGGGRIYYQGVSGSLIAVMATGQASPGVAGDTITQFERPSLGNANSIAFRTMLATNGQAVYKGNPNNLATMLPVAVSGYTNAQVPSVPAGSHLWSLWSPFSSASGKIAFRGTLVDGNNVETRCILTDVSGTLAVIAKVGDTAPDTGGDTFVNFDHPVIGDGDQVAFTASTQGGVVGLWKQAAGGGALSLVVKVGDTFTINSVTETVASLIIPGASSADRTYETRCMDAAGHLLVHVTYLSGKTGILLSAP